MNTQNSDQRDHWSGPAGEIWVREQATQDAFLYPVLQVLLDEAQLKSGAQVLDIGCGTGDSSLAISRITGPSGRVCGADISGVMLDAARARAAATGADNTTFLLGDAQVDDLGSGFDAAVSRFGVMFFADPSAAFANIARALRPRGSMTFVCWAARADNPWFNLAAQIGDRIWGAGQPPVPHAPGPMGFADADHVTGLMQGAGLTDVRAQDIWVNLHAGDTLDAACDLASRMTPISGRWQAEGADPADHARIIKGFAQAFAPYASSTGVRIPAHLLVYSAQTQGA